MLFSSKPVINTRGSNVTCKIYVGCLNIRFCSDTYKLSYLKKKISGLTPSKSVRLHQE